MVERVDWKHCPKCGGLYASIPLGDAEWSLHSKHMKFEEVHTCDPKRVVVRTIMKMERGW